MMRYFGLLRVMLIFMLGSMTTSINTTIMPSFLPSFLPSPIPTQPPSEGPTILPSPYPTILPTISPTILPTSSPTSIPTSVPTAYDVRVLSGSGSCTGSNCAVSYTFDLVEFQLDDAWTSVFLRIDNLKGDLATSGVEYVIVYAGGYDTGVRCSTSEDCGGSAGMTDGVGDTCVQYLNISEYAPSGAMRGSNDALAARLLLEIELQASAFVNSCSPFVSADITLFVQFDPSSFAPTTTSIPTSVPSTLPTSLPSLLPSTLPTSVPSFPPTPPPTPSPSLTPTLDPTHTPTTHPTSIPSLIPTSSPSPQRPFNCSGSCGCGTCSNIASVVVAVGLCCVGLCVFVLYYYVIKSNDQLRHRDSVEEPHLDGDAGDNVNRSNWFRSAGVLLGIVEDEFLIDIPIVEFRRTTRYRAAVIAARVLQRQIKNARTDVDRLENGESHSLDTIASTPKNMTKVDVNVGGVSIGAAVVETVDNSDWIEVGENDEPLDQPVSSVSLGSLSICNPSSLVLEDQSGVETMEFSDDVGHGDILLDRLCTICLVDIEDRDPAMELNCFHFYHADCLQSWLEVSTTCPLCKAQAIPPPRRFLSSIYVSTILFFEDLWLWLANECTFRQCCWWCKGRSGASSDGTESKKGLSSNVEMKKTASGVDINEESDEESSAEYASDATDDTVGSDEEYQTEQVVSSHKVQTLREKAKIARAMRDAHASIDMVSEFTRSGSSIAYDEDEVPTLETRLAFRTLQKEAAERGSIGGFEEENEHDERTTDTKQNGQVSYSDDLGSVGKDYEALKARDAVFDQSNNDTTSQLSHEGNVPFTMDEVINDASVDATFQGDVASERVNEGAVDTNEGVLGEDAWAEIESEEDNEDWGEELGVAAVDHWDSSDEDATRTLISNANKDLMPPSSKDSAQNHNIEGSNSQHVPSLVGRSQEDDEKEEDEDDDDDDLGGQQRHHQKFSASLNTSDGVNGGDRRRDSDSSDVSGDSGDATSSSGHSYSVEHSRSFTSDDDDDARSGGDYRRKGQYETAERGSDSVSSLDSIEGGIDSPQTGSESNIDIQEGSAEWDPLDQSEEVNLTFAACFDLISSDLQKLVTTGDLTLIEARKLSSFEQQSDVTSPLQPFTMSTLPMVTATPAPAVRPTRGHGLVGPPGLRKSRKDPVPDEQGWGSSSEEENEARVEPNNEATMEVTSGGSGIPHSSVPSSGLSRQQSDEAMAEVAQIIEEFEMEKENAVGREDYPRAEELRLEISALKRSARSEELAEIYIPPGVDSAISPTIPPNKDEVTLEVLDEILADLETEKRKAVASNDFRRADELRSEIRGVKAEKEQLINLRSISD